MNARLSMISVKQIRPVGLRKPSDAAPVERPKADTKHFGVLIRRQSSLSATPEGKLMCALLSLAWADASEKRSSADKRRAHEFFLNGGAQRIADLIGYAGDIAQIFRDHNREYGVYG